MFTNSEESGKVSSAKETQDSPSTIDEVLDSPIIDISAPSSNSNVSELPQIIKTSDVSRNVNSPETSPFTGKFESKATPEGLQEDEKVKSSSEKDLKVFSTNDNSASNSDTTASYETVETTALSEPTFRGNKQLSATTELKQLAVPSDVTGFTNDAFELEVFQKKDDTQIQVTSSTTPVAQYQQTTVGWDVIRSRAMVVLLTGLILWAAIFFPLLHNGMI